MKIAAFVSSSSHRGNTATAAQRLLEGAQAAGAETRICYLNDYNIKPCLGCRTCERTNRCVIRDDDVPALHEALNWADAYVLATPTYYGDITGQFKQFVDRCYPFVDVFKDPETQTMRFGSTMKQRRPGVMIAVSGSHGDMVLDSHLKVGYFCFNDLNAYPWREVLIPFTTWKPVREQPDKLDELYAAGRDLAAHLAAGGQEDPARTQLFYDRYRLLKYSDDFWTLAGLRP